jgi:ADP-ribosylation factor-like protein 6
MSVLDKLNNLFSSKRKNANILLVGLDNSGKTSIINYLKPPDAKVVNVAPTIGFSIEKFSAKAINFVTFDMSGQSKYRYLWEHYYKEAHGIIYVVDSSDRMRIVVSKEELYSMLNHAEMIDKNIPILILANKMDIKGSCTVAQVQELLEVDKIKNRPWHIYSSNAITGQGIDEAIEWLAKMIQTS